MQICGKKERKKERNGVNDVLSLYLAYPNWYVI
jgi:hypothetical protein